MEENMSKLTVSTVFADCQIKFWAIYRRSDYQVWIPYMCGKPYLYYFDHDPHSIAI